MNRENIGDGEGNSMTTLALPADQGGHQSHVAAALSTNLQHLNQQKQLQAALQADLCSICKLLMLPMLLSNGQNADNTFCELLSDLLEIDC